MASAHGDFVINDEDSVVSIKDVVDEEQKLQDTANAVLGDSDDTNCTYTKGYVSRQALYACATCNPSDSQEGGVCLACSLKCHEGHKLYELYTKRNFKCDCGNSKFTAFSCLLCPDKDDTNPNNKYNHNFNGLYCVCNRPYPDIEEKEEDSNEEENEMIQCVVCEDWFHTIHLTVPPPDSYEELICDKCINTLPFLQSYMINICTPIKTDSTNDKPIDVGTNNTELVTVADSHTEVDSHSCSSTIETDCRLLNSSNAIDNKENLPTQPPSCKLAKKLCLIDTKETTPTTGYFLSGWRTELCKCPSCLKLYKDRNIEFLTDPQDTMTSYEDRACNVTYLHEAGMQAMTSTMGHVQQVEMIHEYNYMKEELSKFFRGFSENKKVVHARDIEDFFGQLQERKKRRVETCEGIPPDSCH